jgi:arsenate reductase
MIKVYHNARCGKSRECLAFLDDANVDYQIINYLKDAPTVEELRELIQKLGVKPLELVRQKEKIWTEQFATKQMDDDEILKAMAQHPILIERPIVVNGDRAVIARPTAKASDIL